MLNLWKGFIRQKARETPSPPYAKMAASLRFLLCETFYLKARYFVSHNRTNNANFS